MREFKKRIEISNVLKSFSIKLEFVMYLSGFLGI